MMTRKDFIAFRPICFRCGCEMMQVGNDETCDVDGNEHMIFLFQCQNCGDEYEVTEPAECEKPDYDFYK